MNEEIIVEDFSFKVVRNRKTGKINAVCIELNDKLHSPTDEQPAWVLYDPRGRPWRKYWMKEDVPHRLNGPAIVETNPDTGVVTYEQYNQNGELHRPLPEPAMIARDPKTGEVIQEVLALNNEIVNENGVPYPEDALDLSFER